MRPVISCALVAALWSCTGRPTPPVGPEFGPLDALRWPDGPPHDFAAHELTLVRFWTDGCPFCEASLPALSALARREQLALVAVYHRKNDREPTDDDLRAMLRDLGVDATLAIDIGWTRLRELMRRHGLDRSTSVSFLVDRRGRIVWVHPGPRLHRSDDPRFAEADSAMRELEGLVAARRR